MKLWVVRSMVGWLCLYRTKPTLKDVNCGEAWEGDFMGFVNTDLNINKCTLPEVTVKNSPQEVEIKLVKKL